MRCAPSGTEDGHEGLVDTPLLRWAYPAHKLTEPSSVDSAELLSQDASGLPEQVDPMTKRRRTSAA